MMVPISSTRRPARGPATDSSSATDVMVDILSGNDRSPGTTALRERPKGTFARSTRPKVPFARKPERAGSAAREPDDQDDQREHAHAGRDRDEALGERAAGRLEQVDGLGLLTLRPLGARRARRLRQRLRGGSPGG